MRLDLCNNACRSTAVLGFGSADIVATIQAMQRENFYKSMTGYTESAGRKALSYDEPRPGWKAGALLSFVLSFSR